jgi:hypothetical protein
VITKNRPHGTERFGETGHLLYNILAMLNTPTKAVIGLWAADEDYLRGYAGATDFLKYSAVPGSSLRKSCLLRRPARRIADQDDEERRTYSTKLGDTEP